MKIIQSKDWKNLRIGEERLEGLWHNKENWKDVVDVEEGTKGIKQQRVEREPHIGDGKKKEDNH